MDKLANYGMRLADLTDEILCAIVKIYDETVGARGLNLLRPNPATHIKESLKARRSVESRFGSKLSLNSKLWIRTKIQKIDGQIEEIIYFKFDANLEPNMEKDKTMADDLGQQFKKRVEIFLKEKQLAVELK